MGRATKIFRGFMFCLILAGIAAALIAAMEWPLSPPSLAATFGSSAQERLMTGVALAGEGQAVRAVEQGEISFIMDRGRRAACFPSTLGSFVIVEHRDGMAGVYAHLAPGSIAAPGAFFEAGTDLGKSGSSGWTKGEGIGFLLFDRGKSRWVNPLLFLPQLPDGKAPTIRSLSLVGGGRSYTLSGATTLRQGSYSLVIDTADSLDAPWMAGPAAPYSIQVFVDGIELVKQVFDIAEGRDGQLFFFSSAPKAQAELRAGDGRYHLASRFFTRGRSLIELTVEDLAGNKRKASWPLIVE